jgi:hypothetical protein
MSQIRLRIVSSRGRAFALLIPLVFIAPAGLRAQEKKPAAPAAPAAKPAAAAAKPAAAAAKPGAGVAKPPTGVPGAHTPATGAAHSPAAGAAHPPANAGARPGVTAAGGHATTGIGAAHPAAGGFGSGKVEQGRNGTQFQRGTHGEVSTIRHGDMTIHRGPEGSFRGERMRPDGSRLVAHRGGGYIEHGYRYGGRDVYRRNYYYHGAYYSRYYNPYYYHGVPVNVYAPAYYYGPAFYGYAYAPWGAPVVYSWGWAGSPWYGYYGAYFTPYPAYASPSLWLTDYLVAQSLQQAYQDQAAAQAQAAAQSASNAAPPAPMTPEVKQAIADEVRRQIALENSERQSLAPSAMPDPASSGIARMLSDNASHVLVAAAALTLTSAGQECAITEGDVLQVSGSAAPNATAVNAVVLASKGPDCAKGSIVSVQVSDLQDMQNHMRATIDQGLGELHKNQGQGGLPPLPASAAAAPTQAPYAAVAPPPDPNEAADVNKHVQEATQAEQDALAGPLGGPQEAPAGPGVSNTPSPAPPVTVSMGQSIAQVEAIMGKPKSTANVGQKTIYVYSGLKVIFVDGKVNDVQ